MSDKSDAVNRKRRTYPTLDLLELQSRDAEAVMGIGIKVLTGAALAAAGVWGWYNFSTEAGLTAAERAQIAEVISRGMKDPDSVRVSALQRMGRTDIVCGNVNAKNAFGAYVGDRPFIGGINAEQGGFKVERIATDAASAKSIVTRCDRLR